MKFSISAAEQEEEEEENKTALDQEQDARIRNCLQRMSHSHDVFPIHTTDSMVLMSHPKVHYEKDVFTPFSV